MTSFRKLALYLRTIAYLRRGQLTQMVYRRLIRKSSKAHRALDQPHVRELDPVDFHPSKESKYLDGLFFDAKDGRPAENVDWHTNGIWQPLRYQPHYFDYLLDPSRPLPWKRAIISDWIAHNEPDKGDGWIPYAVSLRMVNWMKYLGGLLPGAIDESWIQSLYGQALWLENNLELHILANHYLKNAKALIFAGLYFAGADADRWRARGIEIFMSELQEQFLADGGHYERSPMYHAIAVEDLLDVFTYLSTGGAAVMASTLEFLRKQSVASLDFLAAILLPDGTPPLFNDASRDVGPSSADLFAYAKAVLGYERAPAPEGLTIRAMQPSGYFIMRDAESVLIIDCGPLGPTYQPGHGHCDCLSYELALAGQRIVVDSGVLDYENNSARRYARSTEAHNTIQIDEAQQSEIWDVFRVADRACPIAASLTLTGPGQATFDGSHDGFTRATGKAVHKRTVRYDRGYWTFEDYVTGSGIHAIQSRVHLHPTLRAQRTDDAISILTTGGRVLAELRPLSGSDVRIEEAPYYPRFGSVETSTVIVMSLKNSLPVTIAYAIVPEVAKPSTKSPEA